MNKTILLLAVCAALTACHAAGEVDAGKGAATPNNQTMEGTTSPNGAASGMTNGASGTATGAATGAATGTAMPTGTATPKASPH